MKAFKHTLKNGLRLVTIPMPTLTSATVTIWVGVGSRYEDESVAGISHFLEHMAFKGGKKYPSAKIVSEAIDAMGAEFNAGTSKDWTNFYIKTQTPLLPKAFDVLADMILTPKLDESEIDKERGVIIEEMNMYEDTPMYRIGDIFEQLIFDGNTLGKDIVGTKETVGKTIKRADFVTYRDTHYHSKNVVITVSGGVTEEEAIELTEKYFGNIQNGEDKTHFQKFTYSQNKPQIKLINKKIEQAHMIVGNIGKPLSDKTKYAEELLETILGGGMSSRLFTEVREKRGLCYTVRMGSDHFIDTGAISTYTGTDPKKAPEALKVILSELHDFSLGKKPLKKEELQKAKDYIKGHIALSLENTRSVGNYFGYDELLTGSFSTPEEDFAAIDKVTEEEVIALSKELFLKNTLNLAIIGPFESSKEFEDILQSA